MRIGNYSSKISLQLLREGGDGLNGQSIHSQCMRGLFDGVSV